MVFLKAICVVLCFWVPYLFCFFIILKPPPLKLSISALALTGMAQLIEPCPECSGRSSLQFLVRAPAQVVGSVQVWV